MADVRATATTLVPRVTIAEVILEPSSEDAVVQITTIPRITVTHTDLQPRLRLVATVLGPN